MNGRLIALGWLLCLLIVWFFVPRRDAEGSLLEERLVLIDVGDQGGVRYRVDADDALRIVAHLEVPEEQASDPLRTFTWGVGLSVLSGSGETVSWTHHMVSRILVDPAGLPLIRSSRPGRRVTDSRIIDLDSGFASSGGILEVTPSSLPPNTRLLLRVFQVVGGTEPGAFLERTWPRPYPVLSAEEYAWYTSWRRRSRAPDALDGETVAVLRRPRPTEGRDLVPMRTLEPGQATAYNVLGPARLSASAVQAGTGNPVGNALSVTAVTGGPDIGSLDGVFRVPEGEMWSIRVRNNATVDVQSVLTSADPVTPWGLPPEAVDGVLRPEERRIRLFRVDPSLPQLVIPVDSGAPTGLLRVDARSPVPGQAARASWRALDEAGNLLAEGELVAPWTEAPFERYTDREDGQPGEVTTRFVLHPQAARTIEWTSDAPIDLRFLVPLGAKGVQPPEYATAEGLRARYASWELAPWVALAPVDLPAALRDQRVKTLVSTVRVERSGPDPDALLTADTRLDTLAPSATPPRFPVLEPIDSDGPFEPWHRTQLSARQQLVVPDDGRVVLEHRLARSRVGQSAALECGGVTVSQRVRSSRGRLVFLGLPPGSQTCRLDAPSGYWFAKHAGPGQRWASRTLYRVDDRTVSLRIPRLEGVESLFVRAYTPDGSPAPTLVAEVDGGQRDASTATVQQPTVYARYFVPEEVNGTGLLVNGGSVQRWTGMRLTLGEDLADSEHEVSVRATSPDGGPVYVRFYATWESAQGTRTLHWPEGGP